MYRFFYFRVAADCVCDFFTWKFVKTQYRWKLISRKLLQNCNYYIVPKDMKQNYTQDVVIMKEIRHALSARLTVMMILFTTQIISLATTCSFYIFFDVIDTWIRRISQQRNNLNLVVRIAEIKVIFCPLKDDSLIKPK